MDPYIYQLPPRVNYEEIENSYRPLKRTSKSYDLLDLEPIDKKYKNDSENKNITEFSNKLSKIEIYNECMCIECRK